MKKTNKTVTVRKFRLEDGTKLGIDANGGLRNFFEFGNKSRQELLEDGFSEGDINLGLLELTGAEIDQIAAKAEAIAKLDKARNELLTLEGQVEDIDYPSSTSFSAYDVEVFSEEDGEDGPIKIGCKFVSLEALRRVHKLSLALRKSKRK